MSRLGRVGTVLLLLLASCVCVLLGIWQWNRHLARDAQIHLIETNLGASPVPITDLLGADLAGPLDPDDVWRPVTVSGHWVADSGVQLRNRPVADANASHALALFATDEGSLLVVDRGWWRQTDVVPDGVLDLPSGAADIVVRLRAAEAPDDRERPPGEVFRVVPSEVVDAARPDDDGSDPGGTADVGTADAGTADAGTTDDGVAAVLVDVAYGALVTPEPGSALGALPKPDTDPRSHLSYAFQWWFFAAAIPVAGVVLHRRAKEDAADAAEAAATAATGPAGPAAGPSAARPLAPGGPGARRPARARRRPTMEDEEDALLDAREREARQARDTSSA